MDLIGFIVGFFASKHLSFLTAFLCWNRVDIVRLALAAREHGIFLEVRDCSRARAQLAYDVRREGALLDMQCPNASYVLEQASSSRAFNLRWSWLLLHRDPLNQSLIEDALSAAAILPDGDVTWAASDGLADVYRIKEGHPLIVSRLGVPPRAPPASLAAWGARAPPAPARRRDLRAVSIRTGVIVSQPQHFRGWSDLRDRQIDTFSKVAYPLMQLAAQDMNFRIDLLQVDLYGEERNGSFDGLVGVLQRRRAELGVASMFMRSDRWGVVHYAAESVTFRSSFMFRQPTQASVSNVFLLPFARGVWAALAALAGGAGALLAQLAALTRDADLRQLTPAEAFTFVIGTVCQQGFYLSPAPLSARLLMFSSLLLALFSFTAYSAKIVSILQAPSDAIQTIDDLVKSPLACGVQETTYKKVYFAESRDPATQRLYRKKLVPLGDAAYLSVVEGIARVRTGLFAFSVEESPGYDIISQTFTNREKCGLHQIPAFTPPPVSIPIRKHSGYKELLATRLRWQRETGLLSRWRRVWMAERPACDASGGDFVTVSLRDVLPALQIVGWGMLLSVVILFIERRVHKTSCELLTKRRRSMDQETDLSPVRSDNYEYIE